MGAERAGDVLRELCGALVVHDDFPVRRLEAKHRLVEEHDAVAGDARHDDEGLRREVGVTDLHELEGQRLGLQHGDDGVGGSL